MLLLPHAAPAADPPASQVIRVGTTRPESAPAAVKPAGQLRVTAYDGFSREHIPHVSGRTPLEIDVTAMLAECPDGNVEINALHIGGWRYNVAGACEQVLNQGLLSVAGIAPAPAPAIATTRSPAGNEEQQVLRCDPATWRCGPAAP